MSYDVSFKAKLEGVEQWVDVGPDWINHTWNTSNMIKEVCGSYPSSWNGKKCADMLSVLTTACEELKNNGNKYKQFEASNGWGTVETTLHFLDSIRKACEEYPTAVIEVC